MRTRQRRRALGERNWGVSSAVEGSTDDARQSDSAGGFVMGWMLLGSVMSIVAGLWTVVLLLEHQDRRTAAKSLTSCGENARTRPDLVA
ncbi:hypothetical protein EEB14_15045 [Rhodococcus sp. WS4]|nr:hypothetical protein EEB14_15045 [Rhodococcus sp. WS4]